MLSPVLSAVFLTEGEGVVEASVLDTIFDVATKLVEFGMSLFTIIIENPILVIFIAAGFVGLGLGIVRKLRRTAGSGN